MNSPFDSSSTNNETKQTTVAGSDEFSIRTMHDDLLTMQKSAEQLKTPPKTEPAVKIPIPAIVPEPQKKQLDPKEVKSEVVHPLLEKVVPPKSTETKVTEIPIPTKSAEKETPASSLKNKSVNNALYRIILIIIILLITGILGLGIYYSLITRQPEQPLQEQEPIAITEPEIVPPIPTEKYSPEKPNYLSLDLATVSSDDIKAALVGVASELKTESVQSPYEFMVVDANNNPVAFPIFATAAKLNLSPALLSSLGEKFSLFIYNDNGNVRLSTVVDVNKKDVAAIELAKQENTFVADAAFLFLDAKPEIQKGVFAASTEQIFDNYTVRYINLDAQKTLSIDYAITADPKLIISTSKDTMRAVLNKLSVISAAPASQENQPILPVSEQPTASTEQAQ